MWRSRRSAYWIPEGIRYSPAKRHSCRFCHGKNNSKPTRVGTTGSYGDHDMQPPIVAILRRASYSARRGAARRMRLSSCRNHHLHSHRHFQAVPGWRSATIHHHLQTDASAITSRGGKRWVSQGLNPSYELLKPIDGQRAEDRSMISGPSLSVHSRGLTARAARHCLPDEFGPVGWLSLAKPIAHVS